MSGCTLRANVRESMPCLFLIRASFLNEVMFCCAELSPRRQGSRRAVGEGHLKNIAGRLFNVSAIIHHLGSLESLTDEACPVGTPSASGVLLNAS